MAADAGGPFRIRAAVDQDVPVVTAIYRHHVLHGTGTFEEVPPAEAEMARRMGEVAQAGWPWLVAVSDAGDVLGYAYAAQFRARSAYRHSCEDSVYVAPEALGRGLGAALLDALMAASRAAGFTRMFAVIGDAENGASIRLHAAAGFRETGRLERIGLKFGRELDVILMQRDLPPVRDA